MRKVKIVLALLVTMFLATSAWATAIDDIVIVSDSGTAYIRSGTTLGLVASEAVGGSALTGVGVQSSGNVVIGNSTGSVYIRDGQDLSGILSDNYGSDPVAALAVQNNDNVAIALVGTSTTTVRIRNGSTLGSVASSADPTYGSVTGLGVQSNNNVVFSNTDCGVWIRNGSTLAGVASDDFGSYPITAMGVQSNGNVVVAIYEGGSTTKIRIRNGTLGGVAADSGGYGEITAMGILSNDDIVIGNTAGKAFILRQNGTGIDVVTSDTFGGGGITALAVQDDDDIFLAQYDSGTSTTTLRIRDGETLGSVAHNEGDYGMITSAAVYVPEPATMSLLALGALGVLLRRRSR